MKNRYCPLMLRTFLAASCFALVGQSAMAQNVNIPDANFKNYLLGNAAINTVDDGEISEAEAAVFNGVIDVVGLMITDLTGIEAFTSITELNCRNNQLTQLYLAGNPALTVLNCGNNQLTYLEVGSNTALTQLTCHGNQLTGGLNLQYNTALTMLDCRNNQLTVLDVSTNSALLGLNCSGNALSTLDVSSNPSLIELYANDNQLTALNLANGTNSILECLVTGNPGLPCIQVDDIAAPNIANWTLDPTTVTSEDCWPFVHIPNAAFKNYLLGESEINTVYDGEISFAEAAAFAGEMDLNGANISDLTGIEAFTALTSLGVAYNQLTALDVSNNTALTILNVEYNQLTTLDVSNNPALTNLGCGYNQLTTLDVSNNLALNRLSCGYNLFTALDISANTALTYLDCSGNALNTLDVSAYPALSTLYCVSTQLTVLDVSTNTALTILECGDNPLTSLDVSANPSLIYLGVSNAQLASLNVANGNNANMYVATDGNASLLCIQVDDVNEPSLASWTIDGTTSFGEGCWPYVYIPDATFKNHLLADAAINTTADGEISFAEAAAYNGALDVSWMGINDLTGIEAFTALTTLDCYYNELTSLDVSANVALTSLTCGYNQLTALDVTSNTALTHLYFDNNQVTAIDVSANTQLLSLTTTSNPITTLDVSMNLALNALACQDNLIETLNVSSNVALQSLNCGGNLLTTLDVSVLTGLSVLNFAGNQLTNVDVSNNIDLTNFYCSGNLLTALDLSNQSLLERLRCESNQLTYLNMANGNNANMTLMYANDNPDLLCIQVDDATEPNLDNWAIDPTASYNEDCATLVGISEDDVLSEVYPNPTSSSVFIATQDAMGGSYALCDLAGKRLLHGAITSPRFALDLSGLPAGIYFVRVETTKGGETHRVVVR